MGKSHGSSSDDGSELVLQNDDAGALIGTDQLAELLDTISKVRQLIGEKTDISVPGAFPNTDRDRASQPCQVFSCMYAANYNDLG